MREREKIGGGACREITVQESRGKVLKGGAKGESDGGRSAKTPKRGNKSLSVHIQR
jgi:hypothetical protein